MSNLLFVAFEKENVGRKVERCRDTGKFDFTVTEREMEKETFTAQGFIFYWLEQVSSFEAVIVNCIGDKGISIDEAFLLQMAHNRGIPLLGIGDKYVRSVFVQEMILKHFDSINEAVKYYFDSLKNNK